MAENIKRDGVIQSSRDRTNADRPGSNGEHYLQEKLGTEARAARFYDNAVSDELTARMRSFIRDRWLAIVGATAADGTPFAAPWIGVENARCEDDGQFTIPRPSSLPGGSAADVSETAFGTLLFVDWWGSNSFVWVRGEAEVNESIDDAETIVDADRPRAWVDLDVDRVRVTECPPLPTLSIEAFDPPWGTDDVEAKKAGFFTESRAE